MGVVTELPFALIILCFMLGAGYAWWLYYHDVKKGLFRHWVIILMVAFRFMAVTVLSFLLLSPMVRMSEKVVEKPIIIVGIDNSESVIKSKDSAFYKSQWPGMVEKLQKELQSGAEVKVFSIGDVVKDGFDGSFNAKRTDISGFFREINTRFANRNVAAMILASDGLYNQGSDPYYTAKSFQMPIYTVAMGDTTLRRDAILKKVISNKIAYKNDRFPVEVLIEMNKCSQQKTKLVISKNDLIIESKEIRALSEQSSQRFTFWLDANQLGINKYRVELLPLDDEANYENNHADVLIEVKDTRQKAAMVYNSPHPDIMAIYQALSASSHFEVTLISNISTVTTWDSYDLVILHQVPSVNSIRDLGPLMKSKASLLFIFGSQTDINTFNNMKSGLVINAGKNSFYDAEPLSNSEFTLFSLSREDQALLNEYPPLQSPFGSYQYSPVSEIMVFQKIANVSTKTPLIMFTRAGERKVGIIAGENIWRWRMANYIRRSGFETFDLLVDKMAIYLSTREDKSFLRIIVKNRFAENEPVEIEAEVFNKSYERVIAPDVNITIMDNEKRSYPFIFSKGNSFYYLRAGYFPVGEYSYVATTKVGNETYQKTGEFIVSEINTENLSLVADHQVLSRIALSHDGTMVRPDSLSRLPSMILQRDEVKSISSSLVKLTDLISSYWVFVLILTLLTVEWVLRKREGK